MMEATEAEIEMKVTETVTSTMKSMIGLQAGEETTVIIEMEVVSTVTGQKGLVKLKMVAKTATWKLTLMIVEGKKRALHRSQAQTIPTLIRTLTLMSIMTVLIVVKMKADFRTKK